MAAKKITDSDRIDAIIAVLAANGMSLPEVLGGDPAPSEDVTEAELENEG
jgi:hypothetical protein